MFHARTGKALATLQVRVAAATRPDLLPSGCLLSRLTVQYHTAAVTSVAFHPATQLLASGSRDGSIACWSLYRP